MKNIHIVALLLVLFFCLTNCFDYKKSSKSEGYGSTPSTDNFVYPGYQAFPDGFGYFQNIDKLSQAVTVQDRAYIRDHGWKLFAGAMQPAQGMDWPVWYTWPTGTQAFDRANDNHRKVHSLIAVNKHKQPLKNTAETLKGDGTILDDVPTPIYPLPDEVIRRFPDAVHGLQSFIYNGIIYQTGHIKSGAHFRSDGDIMTATESFSQEGYSWIRQNELYKKETLENGLAAYKKGAGPHIIKSVPRWITTKHMYWPVLQGELGVLPVWNEDFGRDFRGYAGYEEWKDLVAIDPSNTRGGMVEEVSYLHNVFSNDTVMLATKTQNAVVHNISDFYYHQITQADWDSWTDADKASFTAASYWAYDKPIGVGDYLVTIANHVNTKEIPTWALQSVWWSNTPDIGKHAMNRPHLPQAEGPWQNYKLTTAYGLPDAANQLEPSFNPYIELVIHPVATNCNNCHARAGFPTGPNLTLDVASYQNEGCENLLSYLNPNTEPCLADHLLTDFSWVLPDLAN